MYADGKHCGQQLTITANKTGNQVTCTVWDSCSTCLGKYPVDLSKAAFEAIASLDVGVVDIIWHFD